MKRLGRRPARSKTPCRYCPKIPDGKDPRPENAVEVSEKNLAAYGHYLECKAVGAFPPDPIVRRNAAVIRGVEEAVGRVRDARMQLSVLTRLQGQ